MMERGDVRFIFRLALTIGEWNVAEMMERMPCTLLDLWRRYFEAEPFGPDRGDIGAAVVASTVANVWRGKGQRPYSIGDFLPKFGKRREQTLAEMQAAFRAAKAGFEQVIAARKAK